MRINIKSSYYQDRICNKGVTPDFTSCWTTVFACLTSTWMLDSYREASNKVSIPKYLPSFKQRSIASKQLMGQLPTLQQHEYNWHGQFWIVVWVVQDHFMSNKDPLEQRSGEMRCFHFHLSSCQGSSSWIGQQFNVRCLYCCPSKVHSTKGKMSRFVFWQWDDVCRSSSWTSRRQETFSFGSASVKSSGICTFRNIYMGPYFSTLATLRGMGSGVRSMKYVYHFD
jgi:hypothetical protein